MLLVHAESLPAAVREPRARRPVCLVAWFPADADAPDRYRAESRGAADLCFAADDATAARLAMLTPRVFRAAPGPKLLALATKWANGRTFYEATRPTAQRARSLPRVFRPEKRAVRVLLQADNFTQGGMEQVVLDLARCLRSRGIRRFAADPRQARAGRGEGAAGRDTRAHSARGEPREPLPPPVERPADRRRQRPLLAVRRADRGRGGRAVRADHPQHVRLSCRPTGVAAYRANDPFTSAYVCVSQMAAHYSDVKLGLPVSKMVLVPNGIDLARLDAAGRGRPAGVAAGTGARGRRFRVSQRGLLPAASSARPRWSMPLRKWSAGSPRQNWCWWASRCT